jgi:hypothetical protein
VANNIHVEWIKYSYHNEQKEPVDAVDGLVGNHLYIRIIPEAIIYIVQPSKDIHQAKLAIECYSKAIALYEGGVR